MSTASISAPESLTLVYHKVGDLEVKLDVYLPTGASNVSGLPAIVAFHGGALTIGDRTPSLFVPMWLHEMCMSKEIIFISADYRLLYPGTGFDQIEDMKALFSFLSSSINEHLPSGVTLDPSRIAVAGDSAGGYIARLAALYADPKPVAVMSLFGMGGDHLADEVVAIKTTPPRFNWATPSEEAIRSLGTPAPLAGDPIWLDLETMQFKSKLGRNMLFTWMWKHGSLVDHLVGPEAEGLSAKLRALPYNERAAAVPANVRCIFPQLNIDSTFPPTFLAHGKEDKVILLSESEHTYEQLQKAGVRSELHVVPGADHGLVMDGIPLPETAGVQRRGFEFLARELGVQM